MERMRRFVICRLTCVLSAALTVLLIGCARDLGQAPALPAAPQHVGRVGTNLYQTPTGQLFTPAGRQIESPGMRPQALAFGPNGNVLATGGKNHTLVLIDPADGRILQTVPLSAGKAKDSSETITGQTSFTGLVFSPDSRRVYLSTTGGTVWVFPIDPLGRAGQPELFAVPNANVPHQKHEIPTGLAVAADGKRLYVAGNLGNRLHELDAESGKALRSWDTGAAPFAVVLAGGKAYVSNLGGRRTGSGDLGLAPLAQQQPRTAEFLLGRRLGRGRLRAPPFRGRAGRCGRTGRALWRAGVCAGG